jgi:hypothetical protein
MSPKWRNLGARTIYDKRGSEMKKKKMVVSIVALGLVAGALSAPSIAKPKKAKPVATTLFLHGFSGSGEVDGVDNLANGAPVMQMNSTEPTEQFPRSMNFSGPVFNDKCTGLPLVFPTWVGDLSGTIVGDAKLSLHFLSAPGAIKARIWTDTPVFSCNEAYIEPASEVIVDVPAGASTVDVVFEDLKLPATANVMVEILTRSPQPGRVLYDATGYESQLSFRCVPAAGKSCTP